MPPNPTHSSTKRCPNPTQSRSKRTSTNRRSRCSCLGRKRNPRRRTRRQCSRFPRLNQTESSVSWDTSGIQLRVMNEAYAAFIGEWEVVWECALFEVKKYGLVGLTCWKGCVDKSEGRGRWGWGWVRGTYDSLNIVELIPCSAAVETALFGEGNLLAGSTCYASFCWDERKEESRESEEGV